FHLFADSKKQRLSVSRQGFDQVISKCCKINTIAQHECGHTSTTVPSWDFNTVNIRFLDTGKSRDDLSNLGSGYVFTLPAEGIANAINEIEVAAFVLAHQVAGTKPSVSFFKYTV